MFPVTSNAGASKSSLDAITQAGETYGIVSSGVNLTNGNASFAADGSGTPVGYLVDTVNGDKYYCEFDVESQGYGTDDTKFAVIGVAEDAEIVPTNVYFGLQAGHYAIAAPGVGFYGRVFVDGVANGEFLNDADGTSFTPWTDPVRLAVMVVGGVNVYHGIVIGGAVDWYRDDANNISDPLTDTNPHYTLPAGTNRLGVGDGRGSTTGFYGQPLISIVPVANRVSL